MTTGTITPAAHPAGLSARETEIMGLIATGLDRKSVV